MNGAYYRDHILSETFLPAMRQLSNGNFTMQQDGATCHTAAATIAFLQMEEVNFWEPAAWPPNSPDLNPVDYCIWNALEEKVYSNHLATWRSCCWLSERSGTISVRDSSTEKLMNFARDCRKLLMQMVDISKTCMSRHCSYRCIVCESFP